MGIKMRGLFFGYLSVGIFFFSTSIFAEVPALHNLSTSLADGALNDLGAALLFRSISPPSGNGRIWGLGLGVEGSVTSMNGLDAISNQSGGTLPCGDVVGDLQLPFGVGAELGWVPSITRDGASFKHWGINARWTWTRLVPSVPFESSFHVGYGTTQLGWSDAQTATGYSFKSNQTQVQAAFGEKLFFIEPFIFVGYVTQSSSVDAVGSVPIIQTTLAYDYSKSSSSLWYGAGVDVRLLLVSLGAQMDHVLGESTTAVRVGVKL